MVADLESVPQLSGQWICKLFAAGNQLLILLLTELTIRAEVVVPVNPLNPSEEIEKLLLVWESNM